VSAAATKVTQAREFSPAGSSAATGAGGEFGP
jgi:hypothetical protein